MKIRNKWNDEIILEVDEFYACQEYSEATTKYVELLEIEDYFGDTIAHIAYVDCYENKQFTEVQVETLKYI